MRTAVCGTFNDNNASLGVGRSTIRNANQKHTRGGRGRFFSLLPREPDSAARLLRRNVSRTKDSEDEDSEYRREIVEKAKQGHNLAAIISQLGVDSHGLKARFSKNSKVFQFPSALLFLCSTPAKSFFKRPRNSFHSNDAFVSDKSRSISRLETVWPSACTKFKITH